MNAAGIDVTSECYRQFMRFLKVGCALPVLSKKTTSLGKPFHQLQSEETIDRLTNDPFRLARDMISSI